jgi:competence ComEA-like helix-hairpin-helix protein
MNEDERRALWIGIWVLLLASLVRFGWEVRPVPPLLPPDASAYETLLPATQAAVADEARRRTPLAPGERLDANRVDAVELARLPGVGPALAGRIVAFREERGWIPGADALLEVSGIGPATLERLRGHLEFGPPPPGWSPTVGGSPADGPPGTRASTPGPVDLNRAGIDELQALPGVGPALAARIVADRDRHGPYASLEELARVSGVGPAMVERIRGRAVAW